MVKVARIVDGGRVDVKNILSGIGYNDYDGYLGWDENAYYEVNKAGVEDFRKATNDIHDMCIEAVGEIVKSYAYAKYGIPEFAWKAIEHTFAKYKNGTGGLPLFARIDYAWDGVDVPRMIEYNGSNPGFYRETALVQQEWGKSRGMNVPNLENALVARWKHILEKGAFGNTLHLTADNNAEDYDMIAYMETLANKAGFYTKCIPIDQIIYDSITKSFKDGDGYEIKNLFTMYPLEWMMMDQYGPLICEAIVADKINVIEPIWKILLTKPIMQNIWAKYTYHPNLLETTFMASDFEGRKAVSKPFQGLGGDGVAIGTVKNGNLVAEVSHGTNFAGSEGRIYQEYAPLYKHDNAHVLFCGWIVGDKYEAMCVREDTALISTSDSYIVPVTQKDE